MIKTITVRLFGLYCLMLLSCNLVQAQNDIEVPIPTEAQLNWQNAELAVVFHYDLHVFNNRRYVQKENHITPIHDYNIFNPTKLDTDQWVKAAKDAGAKIAILTASHETGFSLYQSKVNPYCLKAVEWRDGKGDIVRDFVASCRRLDVLPGVYIGIRFNSFFGVNSHKINGVGEFVENRQKYYSTMIQGMFTEIIKNYGDLALIWFDGGVLSPELGGPDLLPLFNKYQPNCIFYSSPERSDTRWGGSESGTVPYPCWGTFPVHSSVNVSVENRKWMALLKKGDRNGHYYVPAFSDAPLRGHNGGHEWFWGPNAEQYLNPVEKLVNMYYKSAGHNSTLILGLTPDPDGLMPEADVERLKEFGDEIRRRFSNPIATTFGTGEKIDLELPKKQKVNQIVLMEDISKGERVRQFVLEGKTTKGWQTIFEGSCIGHKFIHRFDALVVSAIRLQIPESQGEPQIQELSVYSVE